MYVCTVCMAGYPSVSCNRIIENKRKKNKTKKNKQKKNNEIFGNQWEIIGCIHPTSIVHSYIGPLAAFGRHIGNCPY